MPIANNGWLISKNSPQYMPTFELHKEIIQKAEDGNIDFAVAMTKFRGFGGETEFWEHALETFTLVAGLAAVTHKIELFPTAATLVMPPAIVARMASTIDSISQGRVGLNVVTGWQKPEYAQVGLWPGDNYFAKRYDYLEEYMTVLKELVSTGHSDFKGEFMQMDDCRVSPQPHSGMNIICAGQSDKGMSFSARHANYNFVLGCGVNTPTAFKPAVERIRKFSAEAQREVGSIGLFMIIADESEEQARAKWESYKEGKDESALQWLTDQAGADKSSGGDTNVKQLADPTSAVNINMGTLVGSYEQVAAMLDEIDAMAGVAGVLLTFDDFVQGVEDFGARISPLMKSQRNKKEENVA